MGTDSTAGFSFRVNPSRFSKIYKIQLRAYDHEGNVRYSSVRYLHNW